MIFFSFIIFLKKQHLDELIMIELKNFTLFLFSLLNKPERLLSFAGQLDFVIICLDTSTGNSAVTFFPVC